MEIATLIVLIAAVALITWKIGSVVLRIVGVLCFIAALAGIASGSDPLTGAFVAFLATVLWLAGHWLFAFRHHVYRSALAQRIFQQALPRWMDPTRNWGIRTVGSDGL
jgi:hypothetical protein